MSAEPFRLTNEPAPRRAAKFENSECRQTVLLSGLDCLPSQQDLFATDGEREILLEGSAKCSVESRRD